MKYRPKIRAGKYGDIPAIFRMMQEAHAISKYADLAPLSEKRTKGLLMNAIQRHGGNSEGSTFVAVAESTTGLEGFIIGILQPLYHVIEALEATDLFIHAAPGANAATAARLLRSMHRWAEKCEGPTVIRQANTDAITSPEKSGRIFERRGMKRVGYVYEKECAR